MTTDPIDTFTQRCHRCNKTDAEGPFHKLYLGPVYIFTGYFCRNCWGEMTLQERLEGYAHTHFNCWICIDTEHNFSRPVNWQLVAEAIWAEIGMSSAGR